MHTLPGATLATISSPSDFSSTIAPLAAEKHVSKCGWLHGIVFAAASLPALAIAVPTYTATDLGTLGGTSIYGTSINALGQITGLSRTGEVAEYAFLYSGGVMTALGALGGSFSMGNDINDLGQVTGWASTTGDAGYHAFLYSGGVMTDLGTLGGASSIGLGINAMGQVTGVSTIGDGVYHAFLYSGGVMKDLGSLGGPGEYSYGNGINALGQVTGLSDMTGNAGGAHAFLYSGGVMYDLNDLLSSGLATALFYASGINDSGQIVANGGDHAYLLTPVVNAIVPEPGSLPLLAAALSGFVTLLRKPSR